MSCRAHSASEHCLAPSTRRLNRRPANAPRPAALPGTADSAEGEASGATAAGAADAASGDEAARCRLFVGNLLSSVDEEQLHDVFGLFGEVQELQVGYQQRTTSGDCSTISSIVLRGAVVGCHVRGCRH